MEISAKFVLLALLASQAIAKSVVIRNTKIPTAFYAYQDKQAFNAIELYIGSGREKVHNSAHFLFDIGYPKFMIGKKDTFGKGVECTDGKLNSCEVTAEPKEEIGYMSKVFTVSKGQTFLSLDSQMISVSKPTVEKAKIDLKFAI